MYHVVSSISRYTDEPKFAIVQKNGRCFAYRISIYFENLDIR